MRRKRRIGNKEAENKQNEKKKTARMGAKN